MCRTGNYSQNSTRRESDRQIEVEKYNKVMETGKRRREDTEEGVKSDCPYHPLDRARRP